MISETAVIWMLGDCHKLNGVIAGFFDSRQNLRGEFAEAGDFFLLVAHTNVRFVNQRNFWLGRGFILPIVGSFWQPYDRGEIDRIFVLDDVICV